MESLEYTLVPSLPPPITRLSSRHRFAPKLSGTHCSSRNRHWSVAPATPTPGSGSFRRRSRGVGTGKLSRRLPGRVKPRQLADVSRRPPRDFSRIAQKSITTPSRFNLHPHFYPIQLPPRRPARGMKPEKIARTTATTVSRGVAPKTKFETVEPGQVNDNSLTKSS